MTTTLHSTPATMRAVLQDRYGGPEVLQSGSREVPAIGPDEVLVEVHAAGLDRGTVHLLRGTPYLVRPAIGLRRPKQRVPGMDLSGVVVRTGSAVARFAPGDAVFGVGRGSFAEYAAASGSKLTHKPDTIAHREAAALPISGLAALHAVQDVARVEAGQSVAVIGASGGVGSYLVQIAKAAGATVTAITSGAKAGFVRSLGADEVLDYGSTDLAGIRGRFDVILFAAGTQSVRALRRMLTERGTLVVIGGEDGDRLLGIGRQIRATLLSPFVRQRLVMLYSVETREDLERLAAMVTQGSVRPQVGATYPLAAAATAIEALEAGAVRGKVVLEVRS